MAWQDEATYKQYAYIRSLEQQLDRIPADRSGLTKRMAKTLIEDLLDELETTKKMAKYLVDGLVRDLKAEANPKRSHRGV
jgi:hypothetical protein